MSTRTVKAVIPAAGLGTRFLPATKAMPKEMLPIVDKPAIQYVVEEASAAGLHDILVITGRNKDNLANHFDSVPELEYTLREKGDTDRLQLVHDASEIADIHFLRQGKPLGLGHAVSRARMHIDGQPFAVLLGDDLIDPRDPLLDRMIAESQQRSASIIALMEVDPSQIHLYGAAAVEATDHDDLVRITGLVEKPAQEDAPSHLAVIGRYVLQPGILDVLDAQQPGRGGEIQLTDALNTLAGDSALAGEVYGIVFRGRRYDTGDRADWIKANVRIASEREDLGAEMRAWLRSFVANLPE